MASGLVFSNGEMFVGLSNYAEVCSLYFPFVGSEQHVAFPRLTHKIGVWVDDQLSWLSDGSWRIKQTYQPECLAGDIQAHNDNLQISLEFSDTVATNQNAFLRNIHVVNKADRPREIRVFMHQAFEIADSKNAETAYFDPSQHAIVHYKGRRVFVVGASSVQRALFDQYTIGLSDEHGHEGTWKDAEDGELVNNSVQMGCVDSIIRLKLKIAAMSSERMQYWIAAGKSLSEALTIHERISKTGIISSQIDTARWWRAWLEQSRHVKGALNKNQTQAFDRSLMLIKAHLDKRGAVMASLDISPLAYTDDAYEYTWARDAAYSIWPLLRLGYKDEAKRYFEFAKRVLSPEGYMAHKHTAEGALGPSWHGRVDANGSELLPVQTDETASLLFMFAQYIEKFDDLRTLSESYAGFVAPMAEFLSGYTWQDSLPKPSYDLWEQQYITSAYTTAVTYGALSSAAELALRIGRETDAKRWSETAERMADSAKRVFVNERTGYIYRGFYTSTRGERHFDDTADISSLYGMYMFGVLQSDEPEMKRATQAMKRLLRSPVNSAAYIRYIGDRYRSSSNESNAWVVPTLWAAQIFVEMDDMVSAARSIDWVLGLEPDTPFIPEQVNPHTGESTFVSPLVWSHAEFINTILDYIATPGSKEA